MNRHGYTGVSWHSRYKKFEARMIVRGRTVSLGSFATAAQAGAAYQAARARTPVPEPDQPRAYGENIASVARGLTGNTSLRVGHVVEMPYDGQPYTLTRLETATAADGRSYTVQHWRAPCRVCGEAFECTLYPQNKGFVRTCEMHRKGRKGAARQRAAKAEDKAAAPVQAVGGEHPALRGRAVLSRLHGEAKAASCDVRELAEFQAIAAQAARLGCHFRDVAEGWGLV